MSNTHRVVVVTGASKETGAGLIAGYQKAGVRPLWAALLLAGACVVAACDQAKPAPPAAATEPAPSAAATQPPPPATQPAASAAAQPVVQPAPPISGVLGKVTKVAGNKFDVQTKDGLVHVATGEDLTTYKQSPSDLSHVTPSSFVGVKSEGHGNGTEIAQLVLIFPPELQGAAEGSVLLDAPPGATAHGRMTNGSVSATPAPTSRMTNGTVQTGNDRTLVVQYQDGAQTISVPPNTPVNEIKPERVRLEAGDVVYAATTKQSDGTLTSNKVFVFISAHAPG
jgi:hypothetical protein